jgi:hypothetical protein
MNLLKCLLCTGLVIALLGAASAALWSILGSFNAFASAGNWPADRMLLIALALALSGLAIAGSIRWAKRRDGEHHLRDSRRPIYEGLVLAWESALMAVNASCAGIIIPPREETGDLEVLLALRGSQPVLRQYNTLHQLAAQPGSSRESVLEQYLTLITEMRRDLGAHSYSPSERAGLRTLLLGCSMDRSVGPNPRPSTTPSSASHSELGSLAAAAPAHRL